MLSSRGNHPTLRDISSKVGANLCYLPEQETSHFIPKSPKSICREQCPCCKDAASPSISRNATAFSSRCSCSIQFAPWNRYVPPETDAPNTVNGVCVHRTAPYSPCLGMLGRCIFCTDWNFLCIQVPWLARILRVP